MADVAVHTTTTDRVAVLTLSHPARRNALNIALSALLAEAVQAAADNPDVGAIVVTGEDPAFRAGGDTWVGRRVLGPQGAAAMTWFGEAVDAAEAERIGLVHRVVDDVVGVAVEMAARAAAASRELVIATKGTMRLTAGMAAQAAAV